MQTDTFTLDYDEPSPGTGKAGTFIVAAITVLLGVGLAVGAIILFRPRPPVVEPAPKIIYKEVVRYEKEPAPPPQIIYKEVEKIVPATPVLEAKNITGEGVWRHKSGQLPMFKVKVSGKTVTGLYRRNWSRVLPFREGKPTANGVIVIVDDGLFRVHFELKMLNADALTVEAWVTDEDWLTVLARANNQLRTLQQAAAARGHPRGKHPPSTEAGVDRSFRAGNGKLNGLRGGTDSAPSFGGFMMQIFLTWLLTTIVYGALIWFGVQRVVRHLKNNPDGVKAVTEHVLLPLLGKSAEPPLQEASNPPERTFANSRLADSEH